MYRNVGIEDPYHNISASLKLSYGLHKQSHSLAERWRPQNRKSRRPQRCRDASYRGSSAVLELWNWTIRLRAWWVPKTLGF